jgi:hypothetical protein
VLISAQHRWRGPNHSLPYTHLKRKSMLLLQALPEYRD